jgi:hypothetical protein
LVDIVDNTGVSDVVFSQKSLYPSESGCGAHAPGVDEHEVVEALKDFMVVVLHHSELVEHLPSRGGSPHTSEIRRGNTSSLHVPVFALSPVVVVLLTDDSDSVVDHSDLVIDLGDDCCVGDMSGLDNMQHLVKNRPFLGKAHFTFPNSVQNGLSIVIVEALTTDVFTLDEFAIEGTNVDLEGSSSHPDILDVMFVYRFRS